MNFAMIVVVALGGAMGSVMRFVMMSAVNVVFRLSFPLGTLIVNVLGSFAIGLLTEWMIQHGHFHLLMRTFLIAGILGGFTTFSAFSLDTAFLIQKDLWWQAALYVILSVGLSLCIFFLGMHLVRQFQ